MSDVPTIDKAVQILKRREEIAQEKTARLWQRYFHLLRRRDSEREKHRSDADRIAYFAQQLGRTPEQIHEDAQQADQVKP